MREHKYKIWDKDLNDFKEYTGTNYEGQSINEFFQDKDLVFLEYTTIKDKKQIEIYDHDYIKNKSGRICIVCWLQPAGCWDARPLNATRENDAKGFSPTEWPYSVKVIGNEYGTLKVFK